MPYVPLNSGGGNAKPKSNAAQKFVQQKQKQYSSGILGDITGSISNIPRGLVGLGEGAVREGQTLVNKTDWSNPLEVAKLAMPITWAPAIVANQVSKATGVGALPGLLQAPKAVESQAAALGGGFFGTARKQQAASHPLLTSQGQSFRATANRLSNPEKLVKDYSSHPFSSLAEDAANVSVVAAPAAKALGGLGLTKSAAAATKVGEVANRLGQGPFIAAGPLAKGANALIGKAGSKIGQVTGLGEHFAQAGQLKALLRSAEDDIQSAVAPMLRGDKKAMSLLRKLPEQEAATVVAEQVFQSPKSAAALSMLKVANPEGLRGLLEDRMGLSTDAAKLVMDTVEAKNPEFAGRAQQAVDATAPGRALRNDLYLKSGPASRAEQFGAAPMATSVAEQTAPVAAKVDKARVLAEKLRLKADSAELGVLKSQEQAGGEFRTLPSLTGPGKGKQPLFVKSDITSAASIAKEQVRARQLRAASDRALKQVESLGQKEKNAVLGAEYNVANAPARLRPALEINRHLQSLLTEHENALRLAGLDASEVSRVASEIPTTLDALAKEGVNPDQFIHVQPNVGPKGSTSSRPTLPSWRKKTGESKFRDPTVIKFDRSIPAQAREEVNRVRANMEKITTQKVGELPMAVRLTDTAGTPLEGVFTPEGAAARGYVPYGPDGVFIPKRIAEQFQKYWHPAERGVVTKGLVGTYDAATKAFKLSVLPLSPSWQVGNAFGNLIQATIGGGIDPATLAMNIGTAIKRYRASGARGYRDWSAVAPPRVFSSGAVHDLGELSRLVPKEAGSKLGAATQKVGKVLGAPARAGYRLNEFVDNVGRSAVYMAKRQAGHSEELAVREALRAMGDFTNMNAFEKNIVRRIVPFYAWQKHITKLAFTLPVEHPLRTAWTLNLANQYGQPDSYIRGLPDFMQGLVPLGGDSVLSTSSLFPFPINPLENASPEGLFRNVNPLIKGFEDNRTGINSLTGLPFSRPAGTGREGDYGKLRPTAPSYLEQLAQLSPQARLIRGLNGYSDIARYSTGDPVLSNGKPIPSGKPTGPAALLKFLGINLQSKKQLEETATQIAATRAKNVAARTPKKTGGSSGGGSGTYPPLNR